jgi:hypothetical protein
VVIGPTVNYVKWGDSNFCHATVDLPRGSHDNTGLADVPTGRIGKCAKVETGLRIRAADY